ncbi:hypothetical protein NUACC26_028210 [Scytonema sp. NUACC26]
MMVAEISTEPRIIFHRPKANNLDDALTLQLLLNGNASVNALRRIVININRGDNFHLPS